MHFKNVDLTNWQFEVEFSFDKFQIPDTNKPAYNDLVQGPDIDSWEKWFSSGSVHLYPYVTEFLYRWKLYKIDKTPPAQSTTSKTPLF